MKTIYCLGRTPQFKLPCIKYDYLLKDNDKICKYMTIPKKDDESKKIEDIEKLDDDEKKEIVNQMLDKIYPKGAIKRSMQINSKRTIHSGKYLKNLKKSMSNWKRKNNNDNNRNETNKNNNMNKSKIKDNEPRIQNESVDNAKLKNENKPNDIKINKNNYLSEPSRNKNIIYKNNLSQKFFNYNYPITHEDNSTYFSQFLNDKYSNKKGNLNLKSINSYKTSFNKGIKISKSSIKTNSYKNKKRSIGIQLNSIKNNKDKNVFHKKYLGNIFGDSIEKTKRKKWENQENELNIIYSENKEIFYRKYDKYRKNENLKGLGLTNINYPPKMKFKELNSKITEIKNKVVNVKSIVDNTFPKILAYLTWTKNEYDNYFKKKEFNSPYKEKLNMMKKHEKYINLYLSSTIEIHSRNKNHL